LLEGRKVEKTTHPEFLFGSSNVCPFYKPEAFKDLKPYVLIKCTKLEAFKARIACLKAVEKEVVVSVLNNFVCDAVDFESENENACNIDIQETVKKFVDAMNLIVRVLC
jgi:hypothetical protein